MSHLIARILLTILMWPLAGLVYFVACFALFEVFHWRWRNDGAVFWVSGVVTWLFVAGYWVLLWRRSVRWEGSRLLLTLAATVAALVISVAVAAALDAVEDEVGAFVGSALFPVLWVVGTILAWRETAAERAARLGGADTLVCPRCGYNLTGLSEARCPECGTRYTLTELYAQQPARQAAEVEA